MPNYHTIRAQKIHDTACPQSMQHVAIYNSSTDLIETLLPHDQYTINTRLIQYLVMHIDTHSSNHIINTQHKCKVHQKNVIQLNYCYTQFTLSYH